MSCKTLTIELSLNTWNEIAIYVSRLERTSHTAQKLVYLTERSRVDLVCSNKIELLFVNAVVLRA